MTDPQAQLVIDALRLQSNGYLDNAIATLRERVLGLADPATTVRVYVDVQITPAFGDSAYATFRDGDWF